VKTGAPDGKRWMSGDQAGVIWHTRCGSEMRRGQVDGCGRSCGGHGDTVVGCDLSRENTSLMMG
jgi:hypothetical protein